MSFASEFKAFALKGNVVDLAVGVIIGAAFGKIVDSVVNDLVMPVVGAIFGGFDFKDYFVALKEIPPGVAHSLDAVKKAGVPVAVEDTGRDTSVLSTTRHWNSQVRAVSLPRPTTRAASLARLR